jgi:hypothetical protein
VQPAVLDGYLPSADERRWWVVDHRTSSGRDEALVLVERDLAGETGGRITLPSEGQPPLAVGSSFFLSTRGSVQRVDALTGDARRIGDGIAVAVDQRTLARVRCDGSDDCGLVLSDLDGGDERVITPPTPRSRYATLSGATFSPDGRWLVTPFFGEDQPGGLALVDVVQGERRFVDSLATSSRGGFPLDGAFTADSRWLLLAAPTADGRPVRAIRIEDSTIVDLDLAVPAVDEGESIELLAIPSIPADADPPG